MADDRVPSMSHDRVWAAIDAFAARQGLTPSGLARRAGLDATTFNRSKRHGSDGRPRWPSTESIAKILEATGVGLDGLVSLLVDPVVDPLPQTRVVPFLDLREAAAPGFFDAGGFPIGSGWDAVPFPGTPEDALYALEVAGDDMLPLYRHGDIIIVSPTAQIRRGDRVVLRRIEGELSARVLVRRTARLVEVAESGGEPAEQLKASEVAWIARIVWASQ